MKKTITYVIIYSILILFSNNIFSQNFRIKYDLYYDQEGLIEFTKNQITSDFGHRRGGNISPWHRGVDYDHGINQICDRILSINSGEIEGIIGSNNYKLIVVRGQNSSFGYGHIFEDESPAQGNGNVYGDFVLYQLADIKEDEYCIIDLSNQIAYGMEDLAGLVVTFDKIEYTIQSAIDIDQPIGILGNSGTSGVHLHLYLFDDPSIPFSQVNGWNDENNDYDPLSVINYKNDPSDPNEYFTRYDIRIIDFDDNFHNQERTRIEADGDQNSSVVVRTIMNRENYGNPSPVYVNDVMDICNVKLFIRPSNCGVEEPETWGTEGSGYQMILGPDYRSEIDLGARIGDERYPEAICLRHGDHEHTGIYPWAYHDYQGYPYDDYYFSDFYTRIHNDNPGNGNTLMAQSNLHARYPDGDYFLFAKATSVKNNSQNDYVFTNKDEGYAVSIDNFAPFVHKVLVYNNENMEPQHLVYAKEWIWSDNGFVQGSPVQSDIEMYAPLWIAVHSSERMNEMNLLVNNQPAAFHSNANKEQTWVFEYSPAYFGLHKLRIGGIDQNNNPLQPDATKIPVRYGQNPSDFDPPLNNNPDENHSFAVDIPVPLDFTYVQNAFHHQLLKVSFISIPEVSHISSYNWDFADGTSMSAPWFQVFHDYINEGQYLVEHSVESDEGNFSVDKLVSVVKPALPQSDFLFKATKNQDQKGEVYDLEFMDNSEGLIAEWHWDLNGIQYFSDNFELRNPEPLTHDFSEGDFFVDLEVSNGLGSDFTSKAINPGSLPWLSVWPWTMSYCTRKFDLNTDNLDPPYDFLIEFGDGSSKTLSNQGSSLISFEHQYFKPGRYVVNARVTGNDPLTADRVTAYGFAETEVDYFELTVKATFNSENPVPYPLTDVKFSVNVNPRAAGYYFAYWIIKQNDDPNNFDLIKKSGEDISDLGFQYQFTQAGNYHVQVNVVDDNGRQGVDEFEVLVKNAPDYIVADICCVDDPVLACINGKSTYYATTGSGPVGNPGVQDQDWYPTNQRWSIIKYNENTGNETLIKKIANTFNYDDYTLTFNRSATFDFTGIEPGTYYLRYESWNNNHNYQENGLLHPKYVNSISYYDFDEKMLIISESISQLVLKSPSDCFLEVNANQQTTQVSITNPGSEPVNWNITQLPLWITADVMGGSGLKAGEIQVINLVFTQNDLPDSRFGNIKIESDAEIDPSIVVFTEQYGTNGPNRQVLYPQNFAQYYGRFGYSVKLDRDFGVVGACSNNGSAYIINKNNAGIWEICAELIPSNAEDRETFGCSVDIYGDYVIVGAENIDKAFIFKKPFNGWSGTINELTVLQNNGSSGDKYASSVTIWGDYAAVGAPFNNTQGQNAGKVQVYFRNEGGTDNWGRIKTLTDCSSTDYFGTDVDMFNDILAVGAPQHTDWNGYIAVYHRNLIQSNDWGLIQKLTATGSSLYNAELGKSVSVFDNNIATAYYDHYHEPYPQFPAWEYNIFYFNGSTWQIGYQDYMYDYDQYINYNDYTTTGLFAGADLSRRSVHGSPCYLYNRGTYQKTNPANSSGSPYNEFYYFSWWPPDDGDNFAHSIGTNYDYIAYGVPNEDENGINTGAVIIDRVANYLRESYCAIDVNLSLVNFEKPAGTYPLVEARNLVIGGQGFPARHLNGSSIAYEGKTVELLPGFEAETGSSVEIFAYDCENPSVQSIQSSLTGSYNLHSFNQSKTCMANRINLFDVVKYLSNANPDYPWSDYNLFSDIMKVELYNNENVLIQEIENPHPTILCMDKPDCSGIEYFLKIYIRENLFKIKI